MRELPKRTPGVRLKVRVVFLISVGTQYCCSGRDVEVRHLNPAGVQADEARDAIERVRLGDAQAEQGLGTALEVLQHAGVVALEVTDELVAVVDVVLVDA